MKPTEIKQISLNLARYRADMLINDINTRLYSHFVNSGINKPFVFTHSDNYEYTRTDVSSLVVQYFRSEGWDVDYDQPKRTYILSHPSLTPNK